jgi:hypothetical protein
MSLVNFWEMEKLTSLSVCAIPHSRGPHHMLNVDKNVDKNRTIRGQKSNSGHTGYSEDLNSQKNR